MNEDLKNYPKELRTEIALGNLLSLLDNEKFLSASDDERKEAISKIMDACGISDDDLMKNL